MALVENHIEAVGGDLTYRARVPEDISRLVIHRTGVADTASGIANFYLTNKEYTGGKFPYHFVIFKDGRIVQCVEVGFVAPGALKLNSIGIQVACHGDFRKEPPTVAQSLALIDLCVALCQWIGKVDITGHTEEAGNSVDPDKVCPGDHLPMDNLREIVLARYTECESLAAELALIELGVTI